MRCFSLSLEFRNTRCAKKYHDLVDQQIQQKQVKMGAGREGKGRITNVHLLKVCHLDLAYLLCRTANLTQTLISASPVTARVTSRNCWQSKGISQRANECCLVYNAASRTDVKPT